MINTVLFFILEQAYVIISMNFVLECSLICQYDDDLINVGSIMYVTCTNTVINISYVKSYF